MPDLHTLASRAEAAAGADRELDEQIGMAIGLKNTMRVGHECLGTDRVVPVRCPAYTASLDAAMTLVPSGCQWTLTVDGPNRFLAHVRGFTAGAATPALALVAASLRALAAQEKNP